MSRNDLRSQALDLLRFPLAAVIVVIHTFNMQTFTMRGISYTMENMPLLQGVNNVIFAFLISQSVPIYFFISGYVFFLTADFTKKVYLQKLKNRVKSLLIPYVLWNLFALLFFFMLFLPCFSFIFPNIHNTQLDFSLSAILNTFWDTSHGIIVSPEQTNKAIYPQDGPLWFVRDLMIVVLATPILYLLLKRIGKWLLLLFGLLWYLLCFQDLGHVNQLLTAFFFFTWGAYMSIKRKDMIREFGRFFKVSMVLYPLLGVLNLVADHAFPEFSTSIKNLNVIAGLFFAYNLSAWLLTHRVCKISHFLSSSSFFIYVAHMIVCRDVLRVLLLLLQPSTEWGTLFVYLLSATTTILSLLLVFYLMRRYTPAFLRIITGRK